jgi:hypothetical protein
MMEFFVMLWAIELALIFGTGPAAAEWLRARRARADFPRATTSTAGARTYRRGG